MKGDIFWNRQMIYNVTKNMYNILCSLINPYPQNYIKKKLYFRFHTSFKNRNTILSYKFSFWPNNEHKRKRERKKTYKHNTNEFIQTFYSHSKPQI